MGYAASAYFPAITLSNDSSKLPAYRPRPVPSRPGAGGGWLGRAKRCPRGSAQGLHVVQPQAPSRCARVSDPARAMTEGLRKQRRSTVTNRRGQETCAERGGESPVGNALCGAPQIANDAAIPRPRTPRRALPTVYLVSSRNHGTEGFTRISSTNSHALVGFLTSQSGSAPRFTARTRR